MFKVIKPYQLESAQAYATPPDIKEEQQPHYGECICCYEMSYLNYESGFALCSECFELWLEEEID